MGQRVGGKQEPLLVQHSARSDPTCCGAEHEPAACPGGHGANGILAVSAAVRAAEQEATVPLHGTAGAAVLSSVLGPHCQKHMGCVQGWDGAVRGLQHSAVGAAEGMGWGSMLFLWTC